METLLKSNMTNLTRNESRARTMSFGRRFFIFFFFQYTLLCQKQIMMNSKVAFSLEDNLLSIWAGRASVFPVELVAGSSGSRARRAGHPWREAIHYTSHKGRTVHTYLDLKVSRFVLFRSLSQLGNYCLNNVPQGVVDIVAQSRWKQSRAKLTCSFVSLYFLLFFQLYYYTYLLAYFKIIGQFLTFLLWLNYLELNSLREMYFV